MALEPKKPDSNVAALMVQAFSPVGLNQPQGGVTAAEIVADARPSAQTYSNWRCSPTPAGQTRKGDLAAAKKRVSLRRKAQRAAVKAQAAAGRAPRRLDPSATGQ